ncbi:NAD(P)-binding protein [Mycena amicta]|nr:NAD(P)-binding protein [Mycena amicta]
MPKRTILVAGATGHQGQALIRSLLNANVNPSSTTDTDSSEFRILALTRNAQSPAAQHLLTKYTDRDVCLVQADLADVDSVRRVFAEEKEKGKGKEEGGVWGVFSVIAYPGLGVEADGAEMQGKNLASIALSFSVSLFVYSSAERAGEYDDDNRKLDGKAKVNIERHVKKLGEKGLRWTLVRPGFFMENYKGFIGSLTVAVFKAGLREGETVPLVAVEDIGAVSAAAFRNPDKYAGQILAVVGDVATMAQQDEAHKAVTGYALPSVPWVLARAVLAMNKDTRELIEYFQRIHMARHTGLCPEVADQIAAAREAHPGMRTLRMWVEENLSLANGEGEKNGGKEGWNEISLVKLLMGRS